MSTKDFDRIVEHVAGKKWIHGAVFHVVSDDGNIDWIAGAGNLYPKSKYYIASINKWFVSAVVLKLIHEGKCALAHPISKYLSEDTMEKLHVFRGVDYSDKITIEHLLSQTSGLPCYLVDKVSNERSIMQDLIHGVDQPCPTQRVVSLVKKMKPHFPPGAKNKAKYIDTNHQLLNLVIERITGKCIKSVLNQLFVSLGMTETYVCENVQDKSYVFPYYKGEVLDISQFVSSTGNDIISTAKDQMTFTKAFFQGLFYPKDQLYTLEKWKSIFFPFQYGVGIQKFYISRILSSLKAVPDMIGHCGSTGSVAFYIPKKNIFITGTINQQAMPNAAFQTMIKIVNTISIKKRGEG